MKYIFTILTIYVFNALIYVSHINAETKSVKFETITESSFTKSRHIHPHKYSQLDNKRPYIGLLRDLPRNDMP